RTAAIVHVDHSQVRARQLSHLDVGQGSAARGAAQRIERAELQPGLATKACAVADDRERRREIMKFEDWGTVPAILAEARLRPDYVGPPRAQGDGAAAPPVHLIAETRKGAGVVGLSITEGAEILGREKCGRSCRQSARNRGSRGTRGKERSSIELHEGC